MIFETESDRVQILCTVHVHTDMCMAEIPLKRVGGTCVCCVCLLCISKAQFIHCSCCCMTENGVGMENTCSY